MQFRFLGRGFLWPALSIVLGLVLATCGRGGSECIDPDLDGFGPGCGAGPDCDESNPLRNEDCEGVPPPDCEADPNATGCPCLALSETDCYPASPETRGVGVCRGGATRCIGGTWGICEGATLPRLEACDGVDQDCDGLVDEGVLSPCGGCTEGCIGGVWGEGPSPFEPGPDTAVTGDGALTLARRGQEATTIWVANTGEDTLSRIDAAERTETARYRTGGAGPTRVAVDYAGDAWVANRGFEAQATLTKVAADPDRCVDRNGNGAIDTSRGPGDVLPEGEDECVLWTVPVGDPGGVARALAIDGDRGLDEEHGGHAWVGMHEHMEVIQIHGATGEVLARVPTPGIRPYAAAFDAWGSLWVLDKEGLLARIDRRPTPPSVEVREVPFECFLLYGFAIDADGRIVLSGFTCDQVLSYDPHTERWASVPSEPSTRGVAIVGDEAWVAHTGGKLSRVTIAPLEVREIIDLSTAAADPLEAIGTAADPSGVWVASSQGGPEGMGVATRVEIGDAPTVTDQVPLGERPHTQGDLSGSKLLGWFVEEGRARRVFEGCAFGGVTTWRRVYVRARPGASGSIEVAVRRAPTREGLETQDFTLLGTLPGDSSPLPLDLAPGGVVEVELALHATSRDGAPRVERVGLEWTCPGPE